MHAEDSLDLDGKEKSLDHHLSSGDEQAPKNEKTSTPYLGAEVISPKKGGSGGPHHLSVHTQLSTAPREVQGSKL